jgi:hypothetical protein
MDDALALRSAIYQHIVEHTTPPTVDEMAAALRRSSADISGGYRRLAARRMIVLADDHESIRMALPFSGVETQHRVRVGARTYFANCAWDAFGIPAALRAEAEVFSRCEQTHESLRLDVTGAGVEDSPWVFQAAVPAAHWWRDIVYT